MPGSVVCCVDPSAEAHDAVRVARGLAAALGLELVLLNVEPLPIQPGVSAAPLGQERLVESEREDADALLEGIVRETGLDPGAVRRRVEFGGAAERILAVCADEGAELVVLGSRGRRGLRATLLGSVSREVAGKAHCIVVLVPPGAAEQTSLSR